MIHTKWNNVVIEVSESLLIRSKFIEYHETDHPHFPYLWLLLLLEVSMKCNSWFGRSTCTIPAVFLRIHEFDYFNKFDILFFLR